MWRTKSLGNILVTTPLSTALGHWINTAIRIFWILDAEMITKYCTKGPRKRYPTLQIGHFQRIGEIFGRSDQELEEFEAWQSEFDNVLDGKVLMVEQVWLWVPDTGMAIFQSCILYIDRSDQNRHRCVFLSLSKLLAPTSFLT
jgi:hypothetical protein